MFEEDKKIDNLESLYKEVKQYVELQGKYIQLDTTEKLTILMSRLFLVLTLFTLGMMALLFCSFMLAYALNNYLDNMVQSFAIVTGIFILLMLLVLLMRKRLFTQPIVNFLGKLLLEKRNKKI